MMLEVRDVSVAFGGVQAVSRVSIAVARGDLLGLIGPNGAGKTTFLRIVAGIIRPDAGSIRLGGRDITRTAIHQRARLGMALTHQIVRPFRGMTLLENVMVAAAPAITATPWKSMLHVDRTEPRRKALALLERFGIADSADRPAGVLPLGYLKRMQVARALAFDPDLLMLDEPLAGLNHTEATRLADLIGELHREGRTIMLIEHNIAEVVRIAKRLAILHNGALLADGIPATVIAQDDVRAAYLGKVKHA